MRKESALLLFLLLLKFFLPFLLSHPAYELHRDEYLYYEQGQHLAFGYLENPPLIGVLAFLSSLPGGGYFWVKFWPALFGAATLWVTVKLARELGGGVYAQLIAALGIIFTAYLRIHFLFQPNFLEIFFWTLSAYFLIRFFNSSGQRYLYALAASLALGWYSKYSVLFFIAALLGGLLLTDHRKLFKQKIFWLALLTGVVLILPNFAWQYVHNWPLFHHMKELRETQLQYLDRTGFLKDQLLMLVPVVAVWLAGLVWLLAQRRYRAIGYTFLLVILLLMLGSGKGYYALGAYPMLLAAGSVWAENISASRRWLRYTFVVAVLLLSFPFIPVLLPLQNPADMAAANRKYGLEDLGLLRWEDGENHPLQQDFADMLGWKELTQKAERFYQQQPDSVKAATLVFGANYGLAGGMKYYAEDPAFRDKIISENGTFLFWIPDSLSFRHLLFVDDEMPEKEDEVLGRFASMHLIDSSSNPYSRQYGTKIFYFQNADDSARIIAERDIRKAKERFSR